MDRRSFTQSALSAALAGALPVSQAFGAGTAVYCAAYDRPVIGCVLIEIPWAFFTLEFLYSRYNHHLEDIYLLLYYLQYIFL